MAQGKKVSDCGTYSFIGLGDAYLQISTTSVCMHSDDRESVMNPMDGPESVPFCIAFPAPVDG